MLGDCWHARAGRTGDVLAELVSWRAQHGEFAIELVLGNYDRGVGRLPVEWDAVSHTGPVADFPFVFGHFPDPSDDGYVLCGHLHPAVVLTGRGRQRLKLPAFWFGPRVGVLPAFGEFTGGAVVTPQPGDRVFVVAGDQVVPVP